MLKTLNAPRREEPESAPGTFYYDDAIARKFLAATIFWAIFSMLVGLFIALEMVFPGMNSGQRYLTFSRLRPLHTNAAVFAFAGNALFCAIYYSSQRLLKTRMWSDKLSTLHFWGWQAIVVAGAVTLPLGISTGRPYAEMEWPISIALAAVWIVCFGGNFLMTVLHRRERHLYVAIWFYLATIITVSLLLLADNLILPLGPWKSYPWLGGLHDALMQAWHANGVIAFVLVMPFLGLMYYFLPKATEQPLYSYRLAIVHFWSLVILYQWAGPSRLLNTAAPDWIQTLGMLASLMLWIPSWAGVINGLLTLRGAWHKISTDPVLRFFVAGLIFYGVSTLEAPLLSFKSIDRFAHFTDLTTAHVHVVGLGWVGFMSFGMMYWLLPRLYQTPLYSQRAAHAHFWIGTVGILLMVIPIYIAGLTQGLMWHATNSAGELIYPDFMETVRASVPMWFLSALGGGVYLGSVVIGGWNFFMTWLSRPDTYKQTANAAPRLPRTYREDATYPVRQQDAIAEIGKKLDLLFTLRFHRKWERRPLFLAMLILVTVVLALACEIVPALVIQSNVPTIASVKPYTPLELIGRDIYIREGCYNCHSQQVRPMISEVRRYTEYSRSGEFVNDHPSLWGSRRVGPDLAREGGRNTESWHYLHLQEPSQVRPGSVMPGYAWLIEDKLDFDSIPARMDAMRSLGVPYTQAECDKASASARAQAADIADKIAVQLGIPPKAAVREKEVVAVIAYLQRLGTDLFASPATQPTTQSATQPSTRP